MEQMNELFVVFEETPKFTFTSIFSDEEKARSHVDMRLKSIKDTEMDGRTIYYKKYVVVE